MPYDQKSYNREYVHKHRLQAKEAGSRRIDITLNQAVAIALAELRPVWQLESDREVIARAVLEAYARAGLKRATLKAAP